MNIKILYLGKTRQNFVLAGLKEYTKRLKAFTQIDEITIPDLKPTGVNTIDKIKSGEALRISKHLKKDDFVIALSEEGEEITSKGLAKLIAEKMRNRKIVFVIGGVYGLDDSIKNKADLCLSFSRFTLTHQMIRLFLMEQIYRAFTIIKGKKYHY